MALAIATSSVRPLLPQAATLAARIAPASWLQLRNETSNDGVLTGSLEVEWRFKAIHPVRGMAVVGDLVLVGTESGDAPGPVFGPDQRGFLTALDASTGVARWTRDVPSWIHGDPAVYRGVAYVTFGRFEIVPGGVMAVDTRSGRTLWTFEADGGLMPAPAIDTATGSVLVSGPDGILYQLSMATGAVEHKVGLRGAGWMASPRIDEDGEVFLGAGGTLLRYTPRTGDVSWRYHVPELHELGDIPVALTDTIVFTTGTEHLSVWEAFRALPLGRFLSLRHEALTRTGHRRYTSDEWFQRQWLLAVDRRDGHLLWRRPLGIGLLVLRNKSGAPVVAGQRVIVSSPVSGLVWAFDLASGRTLWSHPLGATHRGAVTITSSEMLLGDRSGHMTWLRLEDGAPVGRCNAGAPFSVFAPMIVGRTLFTATGDGWVHALPYDNVRQQATVAGETSCF